MSHIGKKKKYQNQPKYQPNLKNNSSKFCFKRQNPIKSINLINPDHTSGFLIFNKIEFEFDEKPTKK